MRLSYASAVAILFAAAGSVHADGLIIGLNWGAGFDGNDAASQTRRDVALAAASMWTAAISGTRVNYFVDMTFVYSDLSAYNSGTLLGRMYNNDESGVNATTGTKLPTKGSVGLNDQATWFWDTTPADNSEFTMDASNHIGAAKVAASAGKTDALSVLLHEIGHVLGFSGATGNWNNFGLDNAPYKEYTDWVNNLNGAKTTYTFDYLNQGLEGGIAGPVYQTVNVNAFHINEPNRVMLASIGAGTRRLITGLEVDMIEDAFKLRLPAPSSFAVLALSGVLVSRRRR